MTEGEGYTRKYLGYTVKLVGANSHRGYIAGYNNNSVIVILDRDQAYHHQEHAWENVITWLLPFPKDRPWGIASYSIDRIQLTSDQPIIKLPSKPLINIVKEILI